jgi:hypothetical protein
VTFTAPTLVQRFTVSCTESNSAGDSSATSEVLIDAVAAVAATITLTTPVSTTAGVAFSVTVTAHDQFGNVAKGPNAYSGTVHFASTDPHPAALPVDFTFSGTDNGAHTFTGGVTLFKAPSQTVAATDTGNPSLTDTQTVTVNPAAAANFLVMVATSPITAGSADSFTATARDQFNNIATGYRGTANFTSSDTAAVLTPASHSFVGGDAGVFTGSANFHTAGSSTVTATDSVTAGITGTSAAVTVNSGAATNFLVVATSPATAGSADSFTVTARDQFNNTATGYTGTANFTSSDSAAVFTPTSHPFVGGDAGVFTGTANFHTAGSQTVTATDSVTAGITGTSVAVTVNPGAATNFLVTVATSAIAAGSADSFTVTARDQFNNTATGYAGTANFTSSDTAAVFTPSSHLFTGVGNDNGVFTGSVNFHTVGSWTVTVADSVTAGITGTSAAVTVNPGAATNLLVTIASNVGASAPTNFTVMARDQFNNTATGYTGTTKFTSSDGAAVLPPNHPFVGSDNGVFTASVTLKTLGSQTVSATDTVTPSITGSTAVTVNPWFSTFGGLTSRRLAVEL